jgi:hypothetical protein
LLLVVAVEVLVQVVHLINKVAEAVEQVVIVHLFQAEIN